MGHTEVAGTNISRSLRLRTTLVTAALCVAPYSLGAAHSTEEPLRQFFMMPPDSARPRVWWHWMNGNITEEGIKLDLEWMRRVGIRGVVLFEGSIDTPQVVPKRLVYMTPEWKHAVHVAVITAQRLGLDMAIASSPGWSATGGPWVPSEQGMKKMVWTQTRVEGNRFSGILPEPSHASGNFLDFELPSAHRIDGQNVPLPRFYKDSAVIAYRLPADDKAQAEMMPKITASGGEINAAALSDGKVNEVALTLPSAGSAGGGWIAFEYATPQTMQSVTLATLNDAISIFDFDDPTAAFPRLEASDDGVQYRPITDISLSSIAQRTVAFPAVTAKFFRVIFPASTANLPVAVTELVLSPAARVNEFEKRAGYSTVLDYDRIPNPPTAPGSSVAVGDVIDLTRQMRPDGTLTWTAPAGRWAILRIGYSLTGQENHPAPAEATGLEVDKLDARYVDNYVNNYLKTFADIVGPSLIGNAGITGLLSDSSETGPQNWTDNILTEFARLRGYDAHPWLPVLTGVIIQSPDASSRFLWDFRRTIANLFAQNHYRTIAKALHKRHMRYYAEALEYHRPSLGDDMEMRRYADVPMGAMWTFTPTELPTPTYVADVRGAASVAHLYGRPIVAAESMTSNGPKWGWSPRTLKRIADLELALGVNQFMIHESAHQPLIDKPPGLSIGGYGLWFNRNETWAEDAGPWIDYLARSSYLLQQGHYEADIAYFYGEEGPLTAVFGSSYQTDLPQGYGYDYVDADAILTRLSVRRGRLTTDAGTSYRILYLGPHSRHMTLPVLRKLKELVFAGAIVAGDRPIDSPSLADDQVAFRNLVDQLWGTVSSASGRALGQGKVYAGRTAQQVLSDLALQPDFEYKRASLDSEVLFLHRKLVHQDIYFVDNRKDHAETVDAVFRITGRVPELWHADTGKTEAVSFHIDHGHTTIPLHLDPDEAVFVIFARSTHETSQSILASAEKSVALLDGAWSVAFQSGRGAPDHLQFDALASWTNQSDPGVKYYSGTATYTHALNVRPESFEPGAHLWLDLGEVNEIARVSVNGNDLGVAWEPPYRVDITNALRPGENSVTIKVTNLWVNRLIGDQQPNAERVTFTTYKPYEGNAPLQVSGLLGPVRLLSISPASQQRAGKPVPWKKRRFNRTT
jgi:hypothetical protein